MVLLQVSTPCGRLCSEERTISFTATESRSCGCCHPEDGVSTFLRNVVTHISVLAKNAKRIDQKSSPKPESIKSPKFIDMSASQYVCKRTKCEEGATLIALS